MKFMGPLEMVSHGAQKGWKVSIASSVASGDYLWMKRAKRNSSKLNCRAAERSGTAEKIHLSPAIVDSAPSAPQLKTLHACIKR